MHAASGDFDKLNHREFPPPEAEPAEATGVICLSRRLSHTFIVWIEATGEE